MSLSGVASVFAVWDERGERFSCVIDESSGSFVVYGPLHPDRESQPPFVAWAHFHSDELDDKPDRLRRYLMRQENEAIVIKRLGWLPPEIHAVTVKLLADIRHFYTTPLEQLVATPDSPFPAEMDAGLVAAIERSRRNRKVS